ncbi:MAG: serine/threonine protein kinase, partial [Deltaproteobacteria bacterium]|nr:serine/threonine protein kinase [Deltaproteobacteria bacterium]
MEETGFCPNCGAKGKTGEPCKEKVCQRHGYHLIPESNYQKVEVVHADPTDPLIGRMIGEYLVVDHIGTGGFGAVYLALQTPIMMKSALKLMGRRRSDALADGEMAAKFKREAAALASLTHPNVVRLLKFGVHADRPYLVMEYVEGGRTLKDEINRLVAESERMEPEVIPHIFRQILNALDAAHSKQIVHRDIKPDNIMLQEVHGDPSFVKVLDFGLAKFTEERTDTSILVGTPVYMAPEQITRKDIGPWTDLYAVGVMLFELVTGRRTYSRVKNDEVLESPGAQAPAGQSQDEDNSTGIPDFVVDSLEGLKHEAAEEEPGGFVPQRGGNTTQEILLNKLDPDFDPMARVADLELPQVAVDFFRKALAKEPADRFQDASAFREAMEKMFLELDKGRGHAMPIGRISGLLDSTEVMRIKLERERLEEERRALAREKKELSKVLEEAPSLPDKGKHGRFGSRWLIVSVFVIASAGVILGLYYALQSAEDIIQRLSGKGNGVQVE